MKTVGDEIAMLRRVHAASARAAGHAQLEHTPVGPTLRLRVADGELLQQVLAEYQKHEGEPGGIAEDLLRLRDKLGVLLVNSSDVSVAEGIGSAVANLDELIRVLNDPIQ